MAYVGEIRLFALPFVPPGWLICDGSVLPANSQQFQALGAVLKNTYGGLPGSTFALPNLQARVVIGAGNDPWGNQYAVGQYGGAAEVTLQTTQIPPHAHNVTMVAAVGTASSLQNNYPAGVGPDTQTPPATPKIFSGGSAANVVIEPDTVSEEGGNGPHPNIQPSISMVYCIAYWGTPPSPN